jgi:hypothetical protein
VDDSEDLDQDHEKESQEQEEEKQERTFLTFSDFDTFRKNFPQTKPKEPQQVATQGQLGHQILNACLLQMTCYPTIEIVQ